MLRRKRRADSFRSPRPAIRLEPDITGQREASILQQRTDPACDPYSQLSWLSRPISGRTLSWVVDGLVVTAALLMFALIFLSIAHELPPWPLTVGTVLAGAIVVAAGYWVIFSVFGGSSLGARLAQAVSGPGEKDESEEAVRIVRTSSSQFAVFSSQFLEDKLSEKSVVPGGRLSGAKAHSLFGALRGAEAALFHGSPSSRSTAVPATAVRCFSSVASCSRSGCRYFPACRTMLLPLRRSLRSWFRAAGRRHAAGFSGFESILEREPAIRPGSD